MLAGPNGAGKSTYYDAFLSESPLPFLNADLFAAETGVDAFEAARVLDATRERLVADGLGFITETVFSDPYGEKLGLLRRATDSGFEVTLIYIGVVGPDLSARRIDQRLAHGGHDVPRDRLAGWYRRSLDNLRIAITFVPSVELFDNSDARAPYQHIATIHGGELVYRRRGRLPKWCRRLLPARRRAR